MGALKEGDPKHFRASFLSANMSIEKWAGTRALPTESDLTIVGLSNFNDFQCRLHDD